ncbi:MAG: DUF1592 domain-containing protein [Verrucomicrobiales bacterium]
MKILILLLCPLSLVAAPFREGLAEFVEFHCYDCHGDGASKGGLDLEKLGTDLDNEAHFAKWEQVFDRVMTGEMPPKKKERPEAAELAAFEKTLAPALREAHATHKGTVLRRLNKIEYENTLNDIFGTKVSLQDLLPADGRSGEFDTVGEALGISMVQMQRYLEAAALVVEAAPARGMSRPEPVTLNPRYDTHDEAKNVFLNKKWGYLEDKAVVFYKQWSYPKGLLRGSNVKETGRYRISVTGYNHQSEVPVTFSIGGSSWEKGSSQPIYAFRAFPMGGPSTIEIETRIEKGYMVVIEPWGISDRNNEIQNNTVKDYKGPGVAILDVKVEGPLLDEWPSAGHHLLFDGVERVEIEPKNPKEKEKPWYQPRFAIESPPAEVLPVLKRIAEAAFRRPVVEADLQPYVDLFQGEMAGGKSYEEALKTSTVAIFCAPDFLFLREKAGKLDDFAVASRLSYFLHRTRPDEELMRLAREGKLLGKTREEAQRLMAEPEFARFVQDFTDSWLNLRDIDATSPDGRLYFEYDRFLQDSMLRETTAYFAELVRENLPVSHLVKADFTFLNNRLAEHYGIEGVESPEMAKVALPENSPRGGFLSQASVLKVSANGTNTSPVRRGVWVLERILGQTPAPPPPGTPGIEPDIRGATTLRDLLDKHRDSTSCNSCHQKIDPPGFALEAFDPVGAYREQFRVRGGGEQVRVERLGRWHNTYLGAAVDASGELPDGRKFDGFLQFRDLLAEDEETLARSFVTKLLTFSTGREMGFSDREEIDRIVAASQSGGYRVRDLILLCTESPIFLTK